MGTFLAEVFITHCGISPFAQDNHVATLGTSSGFIGWRIFKLFEIVLICPIVNIHFGVKVFPAFWTGLPISRVILCIMITA
jgi:hypothetical protein